MLLLFSAVSVLDRFLVSDRVRWRQTPLAREMNDERKSLSFHNSSYSISFLDILAVDEVDLCFSYCFFPRSWGYPARLLQQRHHPAKELIRCSLPFLFVLCLFLRFDFLLFYFDRQSKMSGCIWIDGLVVIGNLFIPFHSSRYTHVDAWCALDLSSNSNWIINNLRQFCASTEHKLQRKTERSGQPRTV